MASYDAFTLGGPYSVRGFSVGELAACRRFAEAAIELRAPVLGRQLFAFYETGSDLSERTLWCSIAQQPCCSRTMRQCQPIRLTRRLSA